MVQESSLLAHLVPRLTNRGEDTATDALAFILNKSARLPSGIGPSTGGSELQRPTNCEFPNAGDV